MPVNLLWSRREKRFRLDSQRRRLTAIENHTVVRDPFHIGNESVGGRVLLRIDVLLDRFQVHRMNDIVKVFRHLLGVDRLHEG